MCFAKILLEIQLNYIYFFNFLFQSSLSNNSKSLNVTKQLREVTDLLNSYQQKIALFNDEIAMLKQQIGDKDKEMNTLKLQLKNLKRSRSTDSSYDRNRTKSENKETIAKSDQEDCSNETPTDKTQALDKNAEETERNRRSMSVDTSDTLTRQYDIAKDELKLLRNKIARLEDDLLQVTQVNR